MALDHVLIHSFFLFLLHDASLKAGAVIARHGDVVSSTAQRQEAPVPHGPELQHGAANSLIHQQTMMLTSIVRNQKCLQQNQRSLADTFEKQRVEALTMQAEAASVMTKEIEQQARKKKTATAKNAKPKKTRNKEATAKVRPHKFIALFPFACVHVSDIDISPFVVFPKRIS